MKMLRKIKTQLRTWLEVPATKDFEIQKVKTTADIQIEAYRLTQLLLETQSDLVERDDFLQARMNQLAEAAGLELRKKDDLLGLLGGVPTCPQCGKGYGALFGEDRCQCNAVEQTQ
jgi:hypothetical protein